MYANLIPLEREREKEREMGEGSYMTNPIPPQDLFQRQDLAYHTKKVAELWMTDMVLVVVRQRRLDCMSSGHRKPRKAKGTTRLRCT